MACCGRRAMIHEPGLARRPSALTQLPPATATGRQSYLVFEYAGRTGMTVVGGVSGRRYRFDAPGARVAVDPMDRASLSAVPHLRAVPGPL
jgi:hypothetical protein